MQLTTNKRRISILVFALSFTYLLSFVFEGQVFFRLAENVGYDGSKLIFAVMIAHVVGLLLSGFIARGIKTAKRIIILSNLICIATSIPFFFKPGIMWNISLMIASLSCGFAVSSWGYFLKIGAPGNDRMKTCADILIFSNLLMILVDFISGNFSSLAALSLLIVTLGLAVFFAKYLPVENQNEPTEPKNDVPISTKWPLCLLCLFIVVLTINSGLMYHVINPAFVHLTAITSWYWSVPYIIALVIIRNLRVKMKGSAFLYTGMGMMMLAFIFFMLLDRSAVSYVTVDTLMLGACGIFDLFWWSILTEILDFVRNPAKVFGLGLAANVLGIFVGGIIGTVVTSVHLPEEQTAVIALTVVCVTLVILPPLNRQLVLLLKSHAYLVVYDHMPKERQTAVMNRIQTLDPLTIREQEVLQLILSGKPNREIADVLHISESTVKTHVRNIFSKYDVQSRAELISILLKNQSGD